jgi:hypothetical protein
LHWQKTVHGYSGIRPVTHGILYDELRGFPDGTSLDHLERMGVTYVIVHSAWFPPAEWERFEQRLPGFSDRLHLEYTDPAGRVYSLPRRSLNPVTE